MHLRFVRLAYLCRLAVHAPDFLLVALDVLAPHPFSFVKLVADDLVWLFEGRDRDHGMPDPRASLLDVMAWVSTCSKRWKKLLFRSRAAATSHFGLTAFGEWWQNHKLKECDSRGFPTVAGADPGFIGVTMLGC